MRHIPFLASPHYNTRPADAEISLIVLHAISLPPGIFESRRVHELFLGTLDCTLHPSFASLQKLHVSAHFVVDRHGDITQFVRCSQRAWHAGVSSWEGVDNCNDYAIGIEMLGDEQQPFTLCQYRETARLCRVLMQQYPAITPQRIVGHSHIAPGRKWDPGRQWHWARFRRSLTHIRKMDLEFLP